MDEKDQKIAELTAELAKRDTTIATQAKTIKTLEGNLATANTANAAHVKTAAEQAATISRQETELKTAAEMVVDLRKQLTATETAAPAAERQTVTIGRLKYELLSDFTWKGKEVTLAVLKADKALAEELVKEDVGSLRQVTAE